jgi:uncharacterized Tic20 family protein
MTDPTPQPAAAPAAPLTEAEDKQWASVAHLGGIIGILPSLIIWLIFKDRGPKTNVEGKEALNFQITLIIGWAIVLIIGSILTAVTLGLFLPIQMILYLAIFVVSLIFSIMGFQKVNTGGSYRYPFALRFIK